MRGAPAVGQRCGALQREDRRLLPGEHDAGQPAGVAVHAAEGFQQPAAVDGVADRVQAGDHQAALRVQPPQVQGFGAPVREGWRGGGCDGDRGGDGGDARGDDEPDGDVHGGGVRGGAVQRGARCQGRQGVGRRRRAAGVGLRPREAAPADQAGRGDRVLVQRAVRGERHPVAEQVGRVPEDGGGARALVLDPELADGDLVPGGDRVRDLPEDGAAGPDEVRGAGQGGAGADERGAVGVEAGGGRRVPRAGARAAAVRGGGRRGADSGDGVRDDPVRGAGVHVAGVAGDAADGDGAAVPVPGHTGGVRVGADVVHAEGDDGGVEADRVEDGVLLPGDRVHDPDGAEHAAVVAGEHGRDPDLAVLHPAGAVVHDLGADDAAGGVRGGQGGADHVPGADEPDSAGDSAAAVPVVAAGAGGGDAAVRDAVHRAVLHHVEHLDGAVLLRVRVPVRGADSAGDRVRGGGGGADVHAPVRGGPPVVVEVVLRVGVGGDLRVPVLDQLPGVRPAQPERAGVGGAVHRVLAADGDRDPVRDGHGGVPVVVLLRALPVFVGEDRLGGGRAGRGRGGSFLTGWAYTLRSR